MLTGPVVRRLDSANPLDLRTTLAPLRHGSGDPAFRPGTNGSLWWAARSPEGPVSVRFLANGHRSVAAAAWGPGADWAAEQLPHLIGEGDDRTGFQPRHPVLVRALAARPGWRLGRSGVLLDSLVPVILEQKVTGHEAHRSWRELLYRFGEPAPGPVPSGLRVPPSVEGWLAIPSWEWHRAGVGPERSAAIMRVCRVAARLCAAAAVGSTELDRALRTVPGIGVWTSAETRQRVVGDPDAVSVGDFHLPSVVGWALAGRKVDDAGMLELLEPYRGHRHRAVRLVELSRDAVRPPRRAPRFSPRDYRCI